MIYIFEDGRIIYDESLLTQDVAGKYLEYDTLPTIKPVKNKVGAIIGCNIQTKELKIEYFDIPLIDPPAELTPIEPEPTPLPLSPTEQAILQTAINTEYMMSLMEVKG